MFRRLTQPDLKLTLATTRDYLECIERALAAMEEFGSPLHPSSRIEDRLNKLDKHVRRYQETVALQELLTAVDDKPAEASIDRELSVRAEKLKRKIQKQRRHMDRDRLDHQIEQLRHSECEQSGPDEHEAAYESLRNQWHRFLSALDQVDTSFTLVGELDECVRHLRYKIAFYRSILGSDSSGQFDSTLGVLTGYTRDAAHWSNLNARCTERLEKERDEPAAILWRALVDRCHYHYRNAFAATANYLDSDPLAEYRRDGFDPFQPLLDKR